MHIDVRHVLSSFGFNVFLPRVLRCCLLSLGVHQKTGKSTSKYLWITIFHFFISYVASNSLLNFCAFFFCTSVNSRIHWLLLTGGLKASAHIFLFHLFCFAFEYLTSTAGATQQGRRARRTRAVHRRACGPGMR